MQLCKVVKKVLLIALIFGNVFNICSCHKNVLQQEEKEPEILKFVDVFGQEYETIINDNIEKHNYKNENFVRKDNMLYYEDDKYISRMGIDVSYHNGTIDWERVKKAGIDFAIIRAGFRGYGTTGSLNVDKEFETNVVNAQKAGLDVGVYFFSQALNEKEAEEEANLVLKTIEGHNITGPVVYDPENILDAKARTDDETGEEWTRNAITFVDIIRKAGYSPMIYCNMLWEAFTLDLEKLKNIPIWYADYESFPQTPYHFTMWQWSEKGVVDGVDGIVDVDIEMVKKE